jgi:hypothetical protein
VQLGRLLSKEEEIEELRKELVGIDATLHRVDTDDIEYEKLTQRRREIVRELEKVNERKEVYDYFLQTGDILYNYYAIQEKIQCGAEGSMRRVNSKAKPGSVLAALEEAAGPGEGAELTGTGPGDGEILSRDKLLEDYLLKVDPQHARGTNEILNDPYGECSQCQTEMIFSANEALFTCTKCGNQEFVLIDSDKPSYKDPPREVTYYAYKRINHFNELLAQFQAKESTEIPDEVFQAIIEELRKERVTNTENVKPAKIREILKKLKYQHYYEHITYILNRINGKTAPVMTREVEEKLRFMFKEIQSSFIKHCPKNRSNFLSYHYVIYKFCELLELDEYLPCFPLLKNRDKLYNQDKIWQAICNEHGWQFLRSI